MPDDFKDNQLASLSIRREDIILTHGKQAYEEYILRTIRELKVNGIDDTEICENLQISYGQLKKYKSQIKKIVTKQALTLDTANILGDSLSSLDRAKQTLNKVINTTNRDNQKINAAMGLVGNEKVRWEILDRSGFLAQKPIINRDEHDPNIKKTQSLVDAIRNCLEDQEMEETESDSTDTYEEFDLG